MSAAGAGDVQQWGRLDEELLSKVEESWMMLEDSKSDDILFTVPLNFEPLWLCGGDKFLKRVALLGRTPPHFH